MAASQSVFEHKSPPPKHVLVVGGGPIGLIQAAGIKRLNPDIQVTVLEKHDEYQRKHTLIMQPAALKAVMVETETLKDPILSKLLSELEKDPHIRTNDLEKRFKDLADKSGVKIIKEEVKKESITKQLSDHNPDFIIGADGTHSVVNSELFPAGNLERKELDYVLQYRYEIKGEDKAESLGTIEFTQHMARHGIVANEYVGSWDEKTNSTPVTMQMMISKEDYEALKHATSKDPIQAFPQRKSSELSPKQSDQKHLDLSAKQDEKKTAEDLSQKHAESKTPSMSFEDIPREIKGFLNNYLKMRVTSSIKNGNEVNKDTIKISVNQAPITYAKKPTNIVEFKMPDGSTKLVPVILRGDASLGLSYFKGLNAGLFSTAQFFKLFKSIIQSNQLSTNDELKKVFAEFTQWFVHDFVPKKIREVESYSTWNIRSFMLFMRVAQRVKWVSRKEDDSSEDHILLTDYFDLMNRDSAGLELLRGRLFPHRNHDLVKFAQWEYIPITYTLKKMGKSIMDYFKAYKSNAQLIQDFKQPIVGIANVLSGAAKLVVGLFSGNIKRFGDGLFSAIRGAFEIVTFPLAWTLKPMLRGLITLIQGKRKIETNVGIKRVATLGLSQLGQYSSEELMEKPLHFRNYCQYSLLAASGDLHRKFLKSLNRGQQTEIKDQEENLFKTIRANPIETTPDQFRQYFSLFAPARVVSVSDESVAKQEKAPTV